MLEGSAFIFVLMPFFQTERGKIKHTSAQSGSEKVALRAAAFCHNNAWRPYSLLTVNPWEPST